MGEFSGQTVLITGASRGLGRACAETFAAEGAELVLVSRGATELDTFARELRARRVSVTAHAADVTNTGEITALIDSLPRCDVLVNNAGGNRPQPFLEVDLATFDHLIALNVRSMFVVAQAAARKMVAAGRGSIVHMSSQMGHVGAANRTVYCLSKHAIEGLTKAMAVELAPHGVRVNAVAPTYIDTPLTKPFFENAAFRDDVLRRLPQGRLGTPAEVAAAVRFLASPAASLITGTSLLVDGGYTAQ